MKVYKQSAEESLALIKGLTDISSSQLFIKLNKWKYPMSAEARILADLFDITLKIGSAKPKQVKPYPRPYNPAGQTRIEGSPISVEEAAKKYKKIQANLHLVKPII